MTGYRTHPACHFCWWGSNIRAGNLAFFSNHHRLNTIILSRINTKHCLPVNELTGQGLLVDGRNHFFSFFLFFFFFFECLLEQVTFLLTRVRSPTSLCQRCRREFLLEIHTLLSNFSILCHFYSRHLTSNINKILFLSLFLRNALFIGPCLFFRFELLQYPLKSFIIIHNKYLWHLKISLFFFFVYLNIHKLDIKFAVWQFGETANCFCSFTSQFRLT